MYDLAEGRNVVFSSSFSKTGAPGLRVGYMIVPPSSSKPIEAIAASTYIGPPPLPQAMLHEFIQRGLFEPNLDVVCDLLRRRRDAMLEGLGRSSRRAPSWSHPDGGYFLWLDLPPGSTSTRSSSGPPRRASSSSRARISSPDDGGDESTRLAFSFPSVEEIRRGRPPARRARARGWPASPRRSYGRLQPATQARRGAEVGERLVERRHRHDLEPVGVLLGLARVHRSGTTKMSAPACFAPITFCLMPPIGST